MTDTDRQLITSHCTDNGFTVVSETSIGKLDIFALSKHGVHWTLTVDTKIPGAVLESVRLDMQVMRFFKPTLDDALTQVFAAV